AVFDLGPHEDRALRDLVAGSSGQVLRGSVVDLAGRPVPGMTLECREERLDGPGGCWLRVTDAEGRYALGRVPPGVLLLTLLDDRRVTRPRARRRGLGAGPRPLDGARAAARARRAAGRSGGAAPGPDGRLRVVLRHAASRGRAARRAARRCGPRGRAAREGAPRRRRGARARRRLSLGSALLELGDHARLPGVVAERALAVEELEARQ